MNYDKIGNFIQQKRKEKNLTQKQLAEKIGVTDRAISKWERGRGCPDVSILEILSKELGCSVLELLKGREIENEVIPVTEADDYVRNSIQISSNITKNKIVSIINKAIVVSIIIIVLLLSYLNVAQINYTSKKYTLKISSVINKEIVENEKIIEENIKAIKGNQGKYSDDDYTFIVEKLEEMYDGMKSGKVYTHIKNREDITYTINEILIFADMEEIADTEIVILDRLAKYTDEDFIRHYRNMTGLGWGISVISVSHMKPYTSYQYRMNSYGEKSIYYPNEDLWNLITKMRYESSKLICLTEIIMEVGEIHE